MSNLQLRQVDILLGVIENLTDEIDESVEFLETNKKLADVIRLERDVIELKSEEIFTLTRCARDKISEMMEEDYEDDNSEAER